MSDLISRQAAIEAIEDLISARREWLCDARDEIKGLDAAICEIENLPSAQPELIRCKDCKWYEIYQLKKDGTDDRRYKPSYCVNLAFHASPDWFCADGERKEE